jgi:hypothetical protein
MYWFVKGLACNDAAKLHVKMSQSGCCAACTSGRTFCQEPLAYRMHSSMSACDLMLKSPQTIAGESAPPSRNAKPVHARIPHLRSFIFNCFADDERKWTFTKVKLLVKPLRAIVNGNLVTFSIWATFHGLDGMHRCISGSTMRLS